MRNAGSDADMKIAVMQLFRKDGTSEFCSILNRLHVGSAATMRFCQIHNIPLRPTLPPVRYSPSVISPLVAFYDRRDLFSASPYRPGSKSPAAMSFISPLVFLRCGIVRRPSEILRKGGVLALVEGGKEVSPRIASKNFIPRRHTPEHS